MPVPKKHHYVPQVYLQRWEDSERLLWIYNLHTATVAHRNKRNVLYEDHLYSLTLREVNLLAMEQKKFFVAPLKEYRVFLDGEELSLSEIVENFPSYDRFQIMKKNTRGILRNAAKTLALRLNGEFRETSSRCF